MFLSKPISLKTCPFDKVQNYIIFLCRNPVMTRVVSEKRTSAVQPERPTRPLLLLELDVNKLYELQF